MKRLLLLAALFLLIAGKAQAQPTHIRTALYCAGYSGTTRAPSTLAKYVDWCGNPSASNVAAVNAAGMKTYQYTDFQVEYPCSGCSPLYSWVKARAAAQAKTCAGVVITKTDSPSSGAGYVTDPAYTYLFNQWKTLLDARYTAYFLDDSTAAMPYASTGSACDVANWPTLIAAGINVQGLSQTLIFNNLNTTGSSTSHTLLAAVNNPNKYGNFEACYGANGWYGIKGNGLAPKRFWLATEAEEIYAHSHGYHFWCEPDETSSNATAQHDRLFLLASFLLTYDEANDVMQERFSTPTDGYNDAQPEYALVPTDPTMPATTIAALETNGVYWQSYGHCYVSNVDKGQCTIMVNPDTVAHPAPILSNFALVIHGGAVFDGGYITEDGQGYSTIPAMTAEIAF